MDFFIYRSIFFLYIGNYIYWLFMYLGVFISLYREYYNITGLLVGIYGDFISFLVYIGNYIIYW